MKLRENELKINTNGVDPDVYFMNYRDSSLDLARKNPDLFEVKVSHNRKYSEVSFTSNNITHYIRLYKGYRNMPLFVTEEMSNISNMKGI